jgi:hypothetical protein
MVIEPPACSNDAQKKTVEKSHRYNFRERYLAKFTFAALSLDSCLEANVGFKPISPNI